MSTLGNELIKRVSHLLETKGWTRGTMSRNSEGYPLPSPHDGSAACFCLLGAYERCSRDMVKDKHLDLSVQNTISAEVRSRINVAMHGPYERIDDLEIMVYNDQPKRTKQEVLDMLNKAYQVPARV